MKEQARMTSGGRITLPLAVRKTLGAKPGDSVVFEESNGVFVVRVVRADSRPEMSRTIKKS